MVYICIYRASHVPVHLMLRESCTYRGSVHIGASRVVMYPAQGKSCASAPTGASHIKIYLHWLMCLREVLCVMNNWNCPFRASCPHDLCLLNPLTKTKRLSVFRLRLIYVGWRQRYIHYNIKEMLSQGLWSSVALFTNTPSTVKPNIHQGRWLSPNGVVRFKEPQCLH